jgi:predicted anti-sigma-YlaC factor YlaD
MLSCKAFAQHLASDYLDQQLTVRQQFGVRMHLMICRNCRRFVQQLKMVRDVLRISPPRTIETQVQATAAKLHRAYHAENKSFPPL